MKEEIAASANSVSDKELSRALRALRRQFNKALVIPDDQSSSLDLLSAVLLLVSLKHLAAENTGKNYFETFEKMVVATHWLYQELVDFIPATMALPLSCPSQDSLTAVAAVLQNSAYAPLWRHSSSIGFAYQIFGTAWRKQALAKVQTANKQVNTETLIAFTQIYTPDWVMDFLLANALLPQIERTDNQENGFGSQFWQWYVFVAEERAGRKSFDQIQLLDPACGAGNFLSAAYDLLKSLYQEKGIAKDVACRQILENQLFGADIDEIGLAVACLSLLTKKIIDAPGLSLRFSNIVSARKLPGREQTEILGSISKIWDAVPEHILGRKYDLVVTNPPYIGRRLIGRELKSALAEGYPLSRADLSAAFLERCLALLNDDGRLGVITQSSLLAIPSYEKFRQFIESNFNLLVSVECGAGVFPLLSGEKANSVLLVIEKPTGAQSPSRLPALKLSGRTNHSNELLEAVRCSTGGADSSNAEQLQQTSFLLQILQSKPQISDYASVRQGLATTNNGRFVRFYWDVDANQIGSTWMPYVKGAGSQRWCSANLHVVRWLDNGREIKQAVSDAYPYLGGKTAWVVKNEAFYFKPGLCFSLINKTRMAVRRLPSGCIFDVASSAIFANEIDETFLLGYLNSTLASALVSAINPTINVQVGDVKKIPLPPVGGDQLSRIAAMANACYACKEKLVALLEQPFMLPADLNEHEKSWQEIWQGKQQIFAQQTLKLEQLEEVLDAEIHAWFCDALSMSGEDSALLARRTAELRQALSTKGEFFTPKQLFWKLTHDVVAHLMRARSQNDALVLFQGDATASQGPLEAIMLQAGIGCNALTIGRQYIAEVYKNRGVLDFARGFRGHSRYLAVRLPFTGSFLLLSRRAVSGYLQMPADEALQFWRGHQKQFGIDAQVIDEAQILLRKTNDRLQAIIDWTTKDLIGALSHSLSDMTIQPSPNSFVEPSHSRL